VSYYYHKLITRILRVSRHFQVYLIDIGLVWNMKFYNRIFKFISSNAWRQFINVCVLYGARIEDWRNKKLSPDIKVKNKISIMLFICCRMNTLFILLSRMFDECFNIIIMAEWIKYNYNIRLLVFNENYSHEWKKITI